MSDALWNSLENACLRMGRLDLTDACERRDLDSKHPPIGFSSAILVSKTAD